MIGLCTDLEKMSISPVIATPCSAASAITGVLRLNPGLITSSLAPNKVFSFSSPTSVSTSGNILFNSDNAGGFTRLSMTLNF